MSTSINSKTKKSVNLIILSLGCFSLAYGCCSAFVFGPGARVIGSQWTKHQIFVANGAFGVTFTSGTTLTSIGANSKWFWKRLQNAKGESINWISYAQFCTTISILLEYDSSSSIQVNEHAISEGQTIAVSIAATTTAWRLQIQLLSLLVGGNLVAMNIVGKGISTQDHLLFMLLLFDAQTKNVFTLCWNRWSRNIKFCNNFTYWHTLMVLLIVYSALTYPFEAALKTSSWSLTKIYILDSIVDAFFLVDLVLTFFVGFFDPRTQLLIFLSKKYSPKLLAVVNPYQERTWMSSINVDGRELDLYTVRFCYILVCDHLYNRWLWRSPCCKCNREVGFFILHAFKFIRRSLRRCEIGNFVTAKGDARKKYGDDYQCPNVLTVCAKLRANDPFIFRKRGTKDIAKFCDGCFHFHHE
ncbi:potassium transport 2/3 [Artemisia annua]|uniref:Potassium transport 2/3 n=1 Tax=Artemisia annua TaxID=35608 RepID=A0A2U1PMP6_ARTAN|nr:potassium transport 2/3 [Artemisia annua]